MLRIVFAYSWEIRNIGNGVQKSILPYKKREKMGIREGRYVRREGRLVIGVIRSKHFLRRDRVKRENRINRGKDRMEGNIVSLSQHDYYGSLLHNYTGMAYVKLIVFSVG